METLRDKLIRNTNVAWLTKPDSTTQASSGQIWPNRRKMLPESGFLATLLFKSHIKSHVQPLTRPHPFRLG